MRWGGNRASWRVSKRSAQPETVKAYRVLLDGKFVVEATGNYLRKRVHTLSTPVAWTRGEIDVLARYGASTVRVFEVRIYA